MWIFGYGSLMWDQWEEGFSCKSKEKAKSDEFRRDFNKASVKNWGTQENPGPTLNLVNDSSSNCEGLAFGFSKKNSEKVLKYLRKREGRNFDLKELSIILESGKTVKTHVPIYSGPNIISDKSLSEKAKMAEKAIGDRGRCVDYIKNIGTRLDDLGIKDKAVQEILFFLS